MAVNIFRLNMTPMEYPLNIKMLTSSKVCAFYSSTAKMQTVGDQGRDILYTLFTFFLIDTFSKNMELFSLP